jgi:hypothetical protein
MVVAAPVATTLAAANAIFSQAGVTLELVSRPDSRAGYGGCGAAICSRAPQPDSRAPRDCFDRDGRALPSRERKLCTRPREHPVTARSGVVHPCVCVLVFGTEIPSAQGWDPTGYTG